MAHLRELWCEVGLTPPAAPLAFPAALRLLNIRLSGRIAAKVNATITAIGRLPLLEDLTIRTAQLASRLSFAPLAALPLLRRLRVWWTGLQVELSDTQVDELRQMTQLQKIRREHQPAP